VATSVEAVSIVVVFAASVCSARAGKRRWRRSDTSHRVLRSSHATHMLVYCPPQAGRAGLALVVARVRAGGRQTYVTARESRPRPGQRTRANTRPWDVVTTDQRARPSKLRARRGRRKGRWTSLRPDTILDEQDYDRARCTSTRATDALQHKRSRAARYAAIRQCLPIACKGRRTPSASRTRGLEGVSPRATPQTHQIGIETYEVKLGSRHGHPCSRRRSHTPAHSRWLQSDRPKRGLG